MISSALVLNSSLPQCLPMSVGLVTVNVSGYAICTVLPVAVVNTLKILEAILACFLLRQLFAEICKYFGLSFQRAL